MVISKMSNIGMRRMKHGGYGPNTEGPNYVLYFKPGQVFKVKYELGPVLPMRITIWSVRYENEE